MDNWRAKRGFWPQVLGRLCCIRNERVRPLAQRYVLRRIEAEIEREQVGAILGAVMATRQVVTGTVDADGRMVLTVHPAPEKREAAEGEKG